MKQQIIASLVHDLKQLDLQISAQKMRLKYPPYACANRDAWNETEARLVRQLEEAIERKQAELSQLTAQLPLQLELEGAHV